MINVIKQSHEENGTDGSSLDFATENLMHMCITIAKNIAR